MGEYKLTVNSEHIKRRTMYPLLLLFVMVIFPSIQGKDWDMEMEQMKKDMILMMKRTEALEINDIEMKKRTKILEQKVETLEAEKEDLKAKIEKIEIKIE